MPDRSVIIAFGSPCAHMGTFIKKLQRFPAVPNPFPKTRGGRWRMGDCTRFERDYVGRPLSPASPYQALCPGAGTANGVRPTTRSIVPCLAMTSCHSQSWRAPARSPSGLRRPRSGLGWRRWAKVVAGCTARFGIPNLLGVPPDKSGIPALVFVIDGISRWSVRR